MQVKNKFILALLSAILLSLSWPERGLTPLVFIAWVPLLLLEALVKTHNAVSLTFLTKASGLIHHW